MLRWLHLFHRWAGIGLCLLFALWFASGLLMMYVEYPELTREERLRASPALDFSSARLAPAKASASLRAGDFALRGTPTRNEPLQIGDPAEPARIDAVRLAMLQGRPAYVFSSGPARLRAVFADTGDAVGDVGADKAAASVAAFYPGSKPRHLATSQSDQWSVSGVLNPHRPLHLFALDDSAGTEVYVSSATGEVVRDSTRMERTLNYFGAVTHWIYPHALRRFPDAWVWTVDCLACSGTALALSGLWIGVRRARRPAPPPRTPRLRLLRWHWLAGLAFGLPALTWVFSGWMSMNPGKLNPGKMPPPEAIHVLSGRAFSPEAFPEVPHLPDGCVEAELGFYDKQPLVRASLGNGTRTLVSAFSSATLAAPNLDKLTRLAPRLLPGAKVTELRILESYDDDYYTRHPERGTAPLPVLRVRFDDADRSCFHLDPAAGRIVDYSSSGSRLFRHLYHGLHSLDWWWLWSRRPLWDIVVITLSLGGLALSLSAALLAYRRLKKSCQSTSP